MIDTAKVLEGINKTIVLTGSMQPARFKNSMLLLTLVLP